MKKKHFGYFSRLLYFVHLTFYIIFNKSRKTSGDTNFHLKSWKYIFQVTNVPMYQLHIHSTAHYIGLLGFFPLCFFFTFIYSIWLYFVVLENMRPIHQCLAPSVVIVFVQSECRSQIFHYSVQYQGS